MSARVTDSNNVALYCSTTGLAFGPVFDSAADANDFLDWMRDQGRDPRYYGKNTLDSWVRAWRESLGVSA